MLIAIVDTETTGLDPKTAEVIELAAVVYDTVENCVIQTVSTLLPVTHNPAERHNNTPAGIPVSDVLLAPAIELINSCDAIAAHRASFDRSFLPHLKPRWIDTLDIWWPRATRQRCNLRELAGYYSIPVWKPHRALTDCLLLSEVFQAEPLTSTLVSESELIWVCAANGDAWNNQEVKSQLQEAGFWWNNKEAPVANCWSRTIYQRDVEKIPFKVRKYRAR